MSSRDTIINPKTGRRVYVDGRVGLQVRMSKKRKKAMKESRKRKKEMSRRSGKRFCTKRKNEETCRLEPNCSWKRKRKICVRKKSVRQGKVY